MELTYEISGIEIKTFYGVQNQFFNLIKSSFPTLKITGRDHFIFAMGNPETLEVLKEKLNDIVKFITKHNTITIKDVESILMIKDEKEKQLVFDQDIIVKGVQGKIIKAKTTNLKKLVKETETKDMVFAIGPAGTGKTYTSVALAVRALKEKQVRRIILTRPAVEAGESLGFLPGDLKEKLDPYLQPLYDALRDMIPHEKLEGFIEKKVIEVAPLAFMRGRTLDDAFVILDEAQNTTHAQMKMFLTRMGMNAKFIITGDPTQVDLPYKQKSGLKEAMHILENIKEIGFVYLNEADVVRHPVVKKIISAYNEEEKKAKQ
ncbi:PhoH family protein [Riemerella anatipestifer]|uniref:PhoH-like protein n=2 Tax=Riemerella anatipestifer TaxID=34085 RepID=E4T8X2_RIEAD|nr:PhoH family protein [Riemerella anatipestifer]ADQ81386.1 PhoH family protein [Riemerella anatipestifer ATCC 11845 = DSM 15868]ADZ13118.1 Phosphate starvation-inducible protein PhoH, predicted ATPase [Riemerella anatipestifer RA-GD]AFD55400.1 phoh family protein [Riemerella anatipestifer ATCC 11845 = DSM 15868]AGC40719.1 Phosphate starvation-inducible protein PhoH, predicted ATPase [Riemerella anatipestifer RA-CH-2]AKP70510.1 phoh family protein [Riemerella anatipestifer]